MSGSGREALLGVRERSGGPPKCPGVDGWPSWMSRRPSWMSGSVQKALQDVRQW